MFCVAALNALQNSMMLRPRWPRAGPIGGDGFALPAGTCNLINPTIFFAIIQSRMTAPLARGARPCGLDLLDLGVFELDRRRPAKDRHCDLDPRLFLVDLFDRAVERGERAVADPHLLADLEGDRRFRPFDPLL